MQLVIAITAIQNIIATAAKKMIRTTICWKNHVRIFLPVTP